MPETLNIPKGLQKSFNRLIDLIPGPFRDQEQVQKDILLFLKLEGEEFVRHKIEESKETFAVKTQPNLIKSKDEK